MKRKIAAAVCAALVMSTGITVYADEKDDRIAELESQVADLEAQVADLEAELAKYTAASDKDEYQMGETWTVPGQWTLTVTAVEETAERNEFADREPAAVYIVTYEYENIGYEDSWGFMDGLYFSMDDQIMDAAGKMGYSYPGDVTMYPVETPVGGTCEGQVCIGVDNPGEFKIYTTKYDGTDTEQKAAFVVTP